MNTNRISPMSATGWYNQVSSQGQQFGGTNPVFYTIPSGVDRLTARKRKPLRHSRVYEIRYGCLQVFFYVQVFNVVLIRKYSLLYLSLSLFTNTARSVNPSPKAGKAGNQQGMHSKYPATCPLSKLRGK